VAISFTVLSVFIVIAIISSSYLADHLIPASDAAPRRGRLRSANTAGTVSLCLAVDSARTAVGRSTMPARQSGNRCLMNSEILTVLIVLNGS